VQEVINCSDLVVLVVVQTFLSIVSLEAEVLNHGQNGRLNWDLVLPYNQALVLADRLVQVEPRVPPDLLRRVSTIWIRIQNPPHEVLAVGRDEFGNCEFPRQNFLV